ncbi:MULTISPECIES: hypothetical protein [Photorhabdus]|uniref:Uncharacterized protein n=1 Tax=Photorhabdus temperata J3 TaxID=1389415 RepID=U7QU62_PHOTE|nr:MULTISPECIES: hypothetical protein [Photorhabdus]EQB98699.1 hypothetical protein B738_22958 [Photorhabdus temperata subsp. temperata M1021]ERT10640.1 hypothetical protein O185_23720 [Photorhabdus temperata J3]MBS9444414.1 hypothetical protein [Photorhabdus heterorhabditis]MCC8423304.1 hypothetical protein [Photorhabdus thracensis]
MTRQELVSILEHKNVPSGIYSLDGLKEGECLCINPHDGVWDVIYSSRGKITYKEVFTNEESAYDRFYQIMKDDYGW